MDHIFLFGTKYAKLLGRRKLLRVVGPTAERPQPIVDLCAYDCRADLHRMLERNEEAATAKSST